MITGRGKRRRKDRRNEGETQKTEAERKIPCRLHTIPVVGGRVAVSCRNVF
jgi:hypothetical protein